MWAKIVLLVFVLISRLILGAVSVGLVALFLDRFLFTHYMFMGMAASECVLLALWLGWTEVPLYCRKFIHRWWQRNKRELTETEDN